SLDPGVCPPLPLERFPLGRNRRGWAWISARASTMKPDGRSRKTSGGGAEEAFGGGRPRPRRLVVLEEHVKLFPAQAFQARPPGGERRVVIAEPVQPGVAPARGADRGSLEVVVIGDAERGVSASQGVVDVVV